MIGLSDILPMYPGYALGGIIEEADLLLPLYEKKRLALEEQLGKVELAKKEETNSEEHKVLKNPIKQKILNTYGIKILKIQREIDAIVDKIDKLLATANLFAIQETLPLDDRFVKLRTDNRAFKAERLDHLVFTSKENVLHRLESFVSKLFLYDTSSNIIPPGTLEAMTNNIETMLGTSNTLVALVGSFITLERVRLLDPLLIRPNTRLGSSLEQKPEKYYVLSEAVLGAVFLGLGKTVSITETSQEVVDKEWMSSLSTVSFISQGAIPKLSHKLDEVNLWKVYNDWKEALIDDPHGGYPIGFKVRRLQNILEENNYFEKYPSNKETEPSLDGARDQTTSQKSL